MKKKRLTFIITVLAISLCCGVYQFLGGLSTAKAQDKAAITETTEGPAQEQVTDGSGVAQNEEKVATENDEARETASLWNWFKKGGAFMWPILFCAALGLGFIIERVIYFIRTKFAPREFIERLERSILEEDLSKVEAMCAESENRMGMIIHKGLQFKSLGYERVEKAMAVSGSVEVSRMERGLSVLNAVANIAPMLGFLGTVSGMIGAFYQIAAADQVSAKIVAGGIMEALITTQTGLIVAIPVLLAYNYFIHRIDGFVSDVERMSSDVVERLIKGKEMNGSGIGA